MKIKGFITVFLIVAASVGHAHAQPAASADISALFPGNVPVENINRGLHVFAFLEITDSPASAENSVSVDDFNGIINEITGGDYTPVSVSDGIGKISSAPVTEKPLVSVTFDGGYRSFYENAFPVLKEKNIPFTIFITPDQIGRGHRFMNWDEVKEVTDTDNATVALQADYYVPLTAREDNDIRAGLNRAIGIFEEKLGFKPEFIAYPFGLYDERVLNIVGEYKFIRAGFGLQSSPIDAKTPIMTLPRFILTGDYADIDRFKIIADALPLPVKDTVPGRSAVVNKDAPAVGFTVDESVKGLNGISCFGTGYGKINTELLGRRVELRFAELPEEGYRIRINCTLPYKSPVDGAESMYWYGTLIQPR